MVCYKKNDVVIHKKTNASYVLLTDLISEYICYKKYPELLPIDDSWQIKQSWNHVSVVKAMKKTDGYYCLNLTTLKNEFIWINNIKKEQL